PAALHLRLTGTTVARQLRGRQGQAHVLGRVAVQIVDPKPAHALGEGARRKGVRAAGRKPRAGAARRLVAARGTQLMMLLGTIGPDPRTSGIVQTSHRLAVVA